tara:strand:+ start:3532 stop:3816 length:285 start_codon:yes stop_codon:yes gene_type:complete
MDLTKGKNLGMNVVLFGVGFTAGYYIYTGLFKQTITLPSLPPSISKLPGLNRIMPKAVVPEPVAPVEEVVVAPPTLLERAQANPDLVTNALILF